MNIREEIENIRKEKFGLNKADTKLVFDTIMNVYKTKIVNEEIQVIGYTLDIVLANMNGFNRLGDVENIYQKWGDSFYIDFNNSAFCKDEVEEDGDVVCSDYSENFINVAGLENIKNISISLKDMIEICKENNVNVKLFAKEDYSTSTTLEMKPYESFDSKEDSINKYLSTIVNN